MSVSAQSFRDPGGTGKPPLKRAKSATPIFLNPDEYGRAVFGYSQLPTGAGQNHDALGRFLNNDPATVDIDPQVADEKSILSAPPITSATIVIDSPESRRTFVTLYPLDPIDDQSSIAPSSASAVLKPSDTDQDPDSADERNHEPSKFLCYSSPKSFFRHSIGRLKSQGCLVFMQGFLSAAWINHIGARHVVDPEFFCRHLDFRPPGDNMNNFSIPALPSSSWHLIELPIFTIGTRVVPKGPSDPAQVAALRKIGESKLAEHHHQISRLSSSGMKVGESMVREHYVFSEKYFAIEQRITICMQADVNRNVFSLLIWLDAGHDFPYQAWTPGATKSTDSHLLPTIRHRHMNALRCHLFQSPNSTTSATDDTSTRRDQSASLLPFNYGRTLNPDLMSRDALYSLSEVLSFTASSQMQFLNLINIELDRLTSLPGTQDLQSLPDLKYIQQILHRHEQKTQSILESIENTKTSRWPKDTSNKSGARRAAATVASLEQDFKHLQTRTTTLHKRTAQAITTLMSSISIAESKRAIMQARRVAKLTFLAFLFVPLSFTTSFFGMNVSELENGHLGSMKWWVVFSIFVTGASLAVFFLSVEVWFMNCWRWLRTGGWRRADDGRRNGGGPVREKNG